MEFTIGLIVGLTIGYILHRQYIKSMQETEGIVKWMEGIFRDMKKMNDEHIRRFKEAEETIKAGGRKYQGIPRKDHFICGTRRDAKQ